MKKKLFSIIMCILMIMCFMPNMAFAEETQPTITDTTITVNPSNAQSTLDGKYGSIDGKTIVLSAGTYDQLILGRATKYEGSNTKFHIGSYTGDELTMDALKESVQTVGNFPYYTRSISNVTIEAADSSNVTVAGIYSASGQVGGTAGYTGHDYVLDRDVSGGTNTYFMANSLSNISFEGITFTAKSDINTSIEQSEISGLNFRNCTFNIGSTANGNQAIRYYNEFSNGKLSNLVVDNCKFNNCYQGVLAQNIYNVQVSNCTFDTTGHNAIAIQDSASCDHGTVFITNNTFTNIGDRIIRFNNVGADTQITIKGNTATNSGDSDKEVIKANNLAEGVTYDISGNDWGKGTTVANDVFEDNKNAADAEGKAEPDMSGTTVNVDPSNVQDVLDGVYGSIGGKTIVLTTGDYDRLYLRQTLKASTPREDLRKDSSYPAYYRAFNNVTIKVADSADVTCEGITAEAGLFWWESAPASNQAGMNRANSGFISYLALNNVTIEGITFDGSTSAIVMRDNNPWDNKGSAILVDGLTIKNCKGTGNTNDTTLHFFSAGSDSNDLDFPGTSKKAYNNIAITGCEMSCYYQPICWNNSTTILNGFSVTNCTFTGCMNNHIQLSNKQNTGVFEFAGDKIVNSIGRLIRMTGAETGTTITFDNITFISPIEYNDDDDEIYKVSGTAGFVVNGTTAISDTWTQDGDVSLLPAAKAKINDSEYRTLRRAINAAENGATIKLLNDVSRAVTIDSGKNVKIDLNGKTISGAIANNGTLNITDSVGGGKVTSKITKGESAAINITGGTFSSNPTAYVDGTNYAAVGNTDGTWTVKALGEGGDGTKVEIKTETGKTTVTETAKDGTKTVTVTETTDGKTTTTVEKDAVTDTKTGTTTSEKTTVVVEKNENGAEVETKTEATTVKTTTNVETTEKKITTTTGDGDPVVTIEKKVTDPVNKTTVDTKVTGTEAKTTATVEAPTSNKETITVDATATASTTEDVKTAEVKLPAATVSVLKAAATGAEDSKTVETVELKTNVAILEISNTALKALTESAGADRALVLKVEKKDTTTTPGSTSEGIGAAPEDNSTVTAAFELTATIGGDAAFTSDNKNKNGNITINVPYTTPASNKTVKVYYVDAVNGTKDDMNASCSDNVLTWSTNHFSTFQVEETENTVRYSGSSSKSSTVDKTEDTDDTGAIDEKDSKTTAAELVKDLRLKARSTKTSKGNIKVTLMVNKDEIKAIEDLGYTVKYKYYRSMKKASSYKAMLEKAGKTYTNTTGKKGTRYYYKARIMVYDSEGTLIAKTALTQCKYAVRIK